MNDFEVKNFNDSYLYQKGEYGSIIYETVIKAPRIDKTSEAFEDIRYIIKRNQFTAVLPRLLDSNNVVLILPATKPLPRSLKVFSVLDVKTDKRRRVFVDCSGYITEDHGKYILTNENSRSIIALLISALNCLIYYSDPSKVINNSRMLNAGTTAFAKLCANIIDYMRIGSAVNVRQKVLYLSAIYYQRSVLNKEITKSIIDRAVKISGLSKTDCDLIEMSVQLNELTNANVYVEALKKIINVPGLKMDNFIDKWLFLYGSGTQFALELYPSFSSLLTNAYLLSGFNNQKQIEKLVGREMVDFTNALFTVGSDLI